MNAINECLLGRTVATSCVGMTKGFHFDFAIFQGFKTKLKHALKVIF